MNGNGQRMNHPYTPHPQPPKKKRHFKPNKEGMTALGILLLIVIIVLTLLILTIKAIVGAVRSTEESTPSETLETPEATTLPPVVAAWHDNYVKESVSSDHIMEGTLILVNFEHEYAPADRIGSKLSALYGSAGYNAGVYALKDSSVKLRREIIAPLHEMLCDLIEASGGTLGTSKEGDRAIISGGHRTIAYQTNLYDHATEDNYVAVPGYSEHHTGYAIDLKVYTSKSRTVDFRDNEQLWLAENCAKYGFIIRYDGTKFETTGILDEPWHYRYVGIPHATYMNEHDLCLEEYISILRTVYTYDSEAPLEFSANGSDYLVYYYPASGDSTTFVPVPPKSVGTYEISGDNIDGYIVTVTKK